MSALLNLLVALAVFANFADATGLSSATVSTLEQNPTVIAPSSPLVPSQFPLPPAQAWCIGKIFCSGALLQTVALAQVFTDPKTIVDRPTRMTSQRILAEFAKFNLSRVTEGDIINFEDDYFLGAGLELQQTTLTGFKPDPLLLNNVTNPMVKAFAKIVNAYWVDLARTVNRSALCDIRPGGPCESTFIPLNYTFVIAGGRYREQYYWDSYWIVQGLLRSELFDTVNEILQNFMDEIRDFGFVPNGGRTYYLNRSQPPLFVHMLYDYVIATGATSILQRGLPSAEAELMWWRKNRTIKVTSPYTGCTYPMARYAVTNSAPRPESYIQDYQVAHDSTLPPLSDPQISNLYSEFASAAETGWDFSSRFFMDRQLGNHGFRSMNVKNTVPICLNSILYKAHVLLAELYSLHSNTTAAARHLEIAADLRRGILDLMWDPSKLAFYDFNLTSNSRNTIFTAATFYPAWNSIIPDEVLASEDNAFGYFAAVNMVMNKYNGTFPATFVDWTGQQWDAPNAWPPHQYIIMKALEALPTNITRRCLPEPISGQSTFDLVPAGQLEFTEGQLPGQPYHDDPGTNVTSMGPDADVNRLDGTVVNGGKAIVGEGWADRLKRELANRYVASALCSWHATGGSIPGLLPRLPDSLLNLTDSINNTGYMFERFFNLNVDSTVYRADYIVQTGFGWTNGVLLWTAANYGHLLDAPQCPQLVAADK